MEDDAVILAPAVECISAFDSGGVKKSVLLLRQRFDATLAVIISIISF
jgi:hypothetical protein